MRPRTALVLVLAVCCLGFRYLSPGTANPSLSRGERPLRPPRIKSCLNSLRSKQQLHRQIRFLTHGPVRALVAVRTAPPCARLLETAPRRLSSRAVLLQLLMRLQE